MIKVVLFDWGNVLRSKTTGRRVNELYRLTTELHSKGIRVGIISNIYTIFAKIVSMLGDYRGFDPVILSCEVKLKKPNPAIFRLALQRCRASPEETIFIDNLQENVDAAEQLGMKVILARNSDQIVADVKRIFTKENGISF